MTEKRLVAVVIWKQRAEPDMAYARQVLRVAAPEALGPAGADGDPTMRVPVRLLLGPSEWPEDFWVVALQALRYPTDYSDPARYDLSGWQGTDARTASRLFVASVYEKPSATQPATATMTVATPPPPARPVMSPPPSAAAPPAPTAPSPGPGGYGPPAYSPPAPGYGTPAPTPGYSPTGTTPGYGPTGSTSGYGPATYGTPGYGPATAPPTQAPYPPAGYGGLSPADAYPGRTGIPSEDIADPNRGFYAGFGQRLLAGVIDAFIGGILLIIPFLCAAVFTSIQPTDSVNSPNMGALATCGFGCLSVLMLVLYHGGFWIWRGQTPGKMVAGIKVVGADGHPPHIGQILLRLLGYVMSFALLGLGFLLIAFDERKQGLADRLANTFVVPVKPPTRARPPQLPGYPAGSVPTATTPPAAPAMMAAAPAAAMPPAQAPTRPADSMAPAYHPAPGPAPTGVQWGPPASAAPTPPVAPARADQWGPPPPPPVAAPAAEVERSAGAAASAPAGDTTTDPAATEAFRQGLDRLSEGVREPGGNRTLLIVEPEAGQAATRAFGAALAAAPQMAVYRYFLGVARRYGEGYGAAGPEFAQASALDPNLWEARLQAYFGTRWHDAFAYPQWSPRATALSPTLQALRPTRPGTRLVLVREGGAKTVAALSMTARSAWHRLPTAEMPARIELVPARSPNGTAIAFYLAVRDDPTDPYRGETFLNPAEAVAEDGDATQLGQNLLLQLARQGHTYLIFVDEDGTVLLNRRLVFDAATQANLAQVAQEVQGLAAGPPLSAERFTQAAQWHMDQYPLDRVAI